MLNKVAPLLPMNMHKKYTNCHILNGFGDHVDCLGAPSLCCATESVQHSFSLYVVTRGLLFEHGLLAFFDHL